MQIYPKHSMLGLTLQLGAAYLLLSCLFPTTVKSPKILMGTWGGGMVPVLKKLQEMEKGKQAGKEQPY